MATEYGRYAPMTPRTMSQNRNSAISSPRTMTPSGTNTGIPNNMESSVQKSMNIPTQTAPGGHRQVPFGGRTESQGFNPNQGRSPVSVNENPQWASNVGNVNMQSESMSPQNPMMMNAFQNQLQTQNNLINRGGYGMEIPRGNPQSAPPQGIYSRPQNGMRY